MVLDAHEGSGYVWLIFLTKIEQDDTFRFFIESEGPRRLSFSERISFLSTSWRSLFHSSVGRGVEDSLFCSLFPRRFRIEDEFIPLLRNLNLILYIYQNITSKINFFWD